MNFMAGPAVLALVSAIAVPKTLVAISLGTRCLAPVSTPET